MSARASRLFALGLCLAACRAAVPSEVTATPAPEEPAPDTDAPKLVLVPWGTALHSSPEQTASWVLQGDASRDGPGRVVRVVEQMGEYWLIETRAQAEARRVQGRAIELLEVYELRMYVAVADVEPVVEPPPTAEAGRAAAVEAEMVRQVGILSALGDPPLQSGGERPPETKQDVRVGVGAKAYWPEGGEAGMVVEAHAFLEPGELREAGGRELRCFAIAMGPQAAAAGSLCFGAEAVQVGEVTAIAELWGDALLDEELVGGIEVLEGVPGGVVGGVVGGVIAGPEEDVLQVGDYEQLGEQEAPLPTVRASAFEIAGPEPVAAQRAVEQRLRSVASCAAEAQARGEVIGLRVDLRLEVSAQGKVSEAALEGDAAPRLSSCIERAARCWRFGSQAPGYVGLTLTVAPAQ